MFQCFYVQCFPWFCLLYKENEGKMFNFSFKQVEMFVIVTKNPLIFTHHNVDYDATMKKTSKCFYRAHTFCRRRQDDEKEKGEKKS